MHQTLAGIQPGCPDVHLLGSGRQGAYFVSTDSYYFSKVNYRFYIRENIDRNGAKNKLLAPYMKFLAPRFDFVCDKENCLRTAKLISRENFQFLYIKCGSAEIFGFCIRHCGTSTFWTLF